MTRLTAIAMIFRAALAVSAAGCSNPKPMPAVEASPLYASTTTADAAPPGDRDADVHPDAAAGPDAPEGSTEAAGPDESVLTGTVLEGPKPTLEDLFPGCKVTKKIAVPKKGPYKGVAIVTSTWPSPAPGNQLNTSYHLAIRTSDGWFIMRYLGTSGVNCGGESLFITYIALKTFEMRDIVPGDPPEVLLTYEETVEGIKDEKVLVCGIGPSRKPSCIGPMTPSRNDPGGSYKSWKNEVIFKPDGSVEFRSGQGAAKTFTIVFP
jgi:hypothetical protein